MVLPIPADYDVQNEALDVIELNVRDTQQIDLNSWGRFRLALHTGTEAQFLHFVTDANGNILCHAPQADVDTIYVETGKTHHEMIRAISFARISHDEVVTHHPNSVVMQNGNIGFAIPAYPNFEKAVKDFYFHVGCFLDNLARIAYIFNNPQSAQNHNQRRRIGWGQVVAVANPAAVPLVYQNPYAANYVGAFRAQLEGIKRVRNSLTHSWKVPEAVVNQTLHWPEAIRSDENFAWWHEDATLMTDLANGTLPTTSIVQMVQDDYQFLVQYQSFAFDVLRNDIQNFENNYHVEIRLQPR